MKLIILRFVIVLSVCLFASECAQKNTVKPEEAFLGDWYTIKGDVEVYSFLKDDSSYIFVGTLDMRPVVFGTWKIEKERFIISMDNGTTTEYSYSYFNDTLTFNDGEEIYTRTMPLDVRYPEIRILSSLTYDLNDLNFTEPKEVNLNWGYFSDSTGDFQTIALNGYAITTASTLSSGDLPVISGYIKDYGFETDTVYMTEICDGYLGENQIITVCVEQDYEAENDSIDITISSALIVK